MRVLTTIKILEDNDMCSGFVIEAGEITSVHTSWDSMMERLSVHLTATKQNSKVDKYQKSQEEKNVSDAV